MMQLLMMAQACKSNTW